MEILILGRGKSAKALFNKLKDNNNVKFAIEENEKIDEYSIYKKDVNINQYNIFYVSPGISFKDKLIVKLKENNKLISSEINYALDKLKKHKIIAISGSNGKTTVASILHFILDKLNIKNVVCGNIGDPLVNYINVSIDTLIILELSSFQLENIKYLNPYISIITNITPNHLDRHTFEEYIECKKNIYKNINKNNYFISDKSTIKKYKMNPICNILTYKKYKVKSKYLKGNHNYLNFGIIKEVMNILNIKSYKKYIKEFKGVKYRLEYIGKYNNTNIYNDAKSSTIYSSIEAVKSVGYNTLLILGGRNKNIDYSSINNIKVKKIIMYGEEAKKTNLKIEKFNDLNDIFNYLKLHINEYKNILYSPGFTSFDLYENYIKRGEDFENKCKEYFKIK